MTSTEFTIGLDGGARNSSKVLKPPGGGSSDIFGLGGGSYPTNGTTNTQTQNVDNGTTKNRLFGGPTNKPTPVASPAKSQVKPSVPDNVPAPKNTKRYVRRNPITGEEIEYFPENQKKTELNGREENDNSNNQTNNDQNENNEEKKTEKVEEEPTRNPPKNSIRVRAPPGGKSSGIFF